MIKSIFKNLDDVPTDVIEQIVEGINIFEGLNSDEATAILYMTEDRVDSDEEW